MRFPLRLFAFLTAGLLLLAACGPSKAPPSIETYDYTTRVVPVATTKASPASGGSLVVTDSASFIQGVKVTIPPGAITKEVTLTLSRVDNPMPLPTVRTFVGPPIALGPSGLRFAKPVEVEIPIREDALANAGAIGTTDLKVFLLDEGAKEWSEVPSSAIRIEFNSVFVQLQHFTELAVSTGSVGIGTSVSGLAYTTPPPGTPEPGDLLFRLSRRGGFVGWIPGHVAIYTGEKPWAGEGNATEAVKKHGKYNVVEATLKDEHGTGGVRFGYFEIPNAKTSTPGLSPYAPPELYMGARTLKDIILTPEERQDIVKFTERQAELKKGYKFTQTVGPLYGCSLEEFSCIGLAEAAYLSVGQNLRTGKYRQYIFTPAGLYSNTGEAGGGGFVPRITFDMPTPIPHPTPTPTATPTPTPTPTATLTPTPTPTPIPTSTPTLTPAPVLPASSTWSGTWKITSTQYCIPNTGSWSATFKVSDGKVSGTFDGRDLGKGDISGTLVDKEITWRLVNPVGGIGADLVLKGTFSMVDIITGTLTDECKIVTSAGQVIQVQPITGTFSGKRTY